jgi:predicted RNase H-like HicB family nuclease
LIVYAQPSKEIHPSLDSPCFDKERNVRLAIETERESDGRWLAEIPELPGTMVYGQTREEAITRVQAMALRVMADRLEHGEAIPEVTSAFLVVA